MKKYILAAAVTLSCILWSAGATFEQPLAPIENSVVPDDDRFLAPDPYRLWVHGAAAEYGVPLDIAIRLAYEESRWWPMAVNKNRNGTKDHGIYQLNDAYHEPMLVRENIYTGIRELARCYRATGTWRKAVMAYNAGVEGSKSAGKNTKSLAHRVVMGEM